MTPDPYSPIWRAVVPLSATTSEARGIFVVLGAAYLLTPFVLLSLIIGTGIFCFERSGGIRLRVATAKKTVVADSRLAAKLPNDIDVALTGDVDEKMLDLFADAIERTRQSPHRDARLRVIIDTTGGLLEVAKMVSEALRDLSATHQIVMIVTGKCWSAGTVILLSVPLQYRYAVRHARFMIHAVTSHDGVRTESTRESDKYLVQRYTEETWVKRAHLVKALRSDLDTIFSARRARKLGFIGAILRD